MASQQIKIENITMNEVLKAMHRLGGQVTRKDIRQDIRDNSDVISDNEVDKVRVSKKTGNKYRPFDWTLNFAIKYLIMTNYIETEDNRELELSKKGRNINFLEFDAARYVRPIVEKQLVEEKENKNSVIEEVESEQVEPDAREESWREQLLNALIKMNPKKFELFCRGLLKKMDIDVDDVIGVKFVADGGLDGFGYVRSDDYRTTRVALQVKRWQK